MNLQESIRRILREETESGKYTKAVKVIVNDFKNEDFVCDIDVYYYADKYEVAVKIDRKEFEKKYENRDISYANILMTGYLDRLKRTIRQEIKNFLPVDVLIWFKQINCDKGLNESEDNKEKKIQRNLKAIRTLLDTIDVDGLCEMWVEYNPEDGDYEIRSKTTRKNLDTAYMVKELRYIEDTIRSWGMKTYVYTPWYVENCEDEVEFMNESEEKKPRLLSTIKEDGLFQVMQDTGLSLPQIYTKTGEIPREVFERYIKDFIKHDGYHQTDGSVQLGYEVEIQTHVYTEHFYMKGDRVTVEIRRFDNRGQQTEGYIESLSNFTDEEIFNIAEDMINWGGDIDYEI